jgi:hypothetical protein
VDFSYKNKPLHLFTIQIIYEIILKNSIPKERKIAMRKQLSFTRHEHKILPNFRQMISKAESTEDVKKFFVYTAIELFENIFEGKMDFEYEDTALMPDSDYHYKVSKRQQRASSFHE